MTESMPRAVYVLIRDLLRDRAGHDLGEGKEYLVESRLSILAESLGMPGPATLIERLRRSRDLAIEKSLIEAMMTGETSFFRNPGVFDQLRRRVLPALIAERSASRRLRIWSAGCSTGQEAYSLAILLMDHFPELKAWDVVIVATDISESAIRQAQLGLYNGAEVRRGLSPGQLQGHFEQVGLRWKIHDDVRNVVTFQRVNLIEPLPFHCEFDVVFLRNVLIYFYADLKPVIFREVRRAIRDDGFLFLGDSETILGVSQDFRFELGELEYYRPSLEVDR